MDCGCKLCCVLCLIVPSGLTKSCSTRQELCWTWESMWAPWASTSGKICRTMSNTVSAWHCYSRALDDRSSLQVLFPETDFFFQLSQFYFAQNQPFGQILHWMLNFWVVLWTCIILISNNGVIWHFIQPQRSVTFGYTSMVAYVQ